MVEPKLIEGRGEEPAFLPVGPGESWQRVDLGLGAFSFQANPTRPGVPARPDLPADPRG